MLAGEGDAGIPIYDKAPRKCRESGDFKEVI